MAPDSRSIHYQSLNDNASAKYVVSPKRGCWLPARSMLIDSQGKWIVQKFWPTSLAFVKCSIIVFMQRLFRPRKRFLLISNLLIIFVSLRETAAVLTNTFQLAGAVLLQQHDQRRSLYEGADQILPHHGGHEPYRRRCDPYLAAAGYMATAPRLSQEAGSCNSILSLSACCTFNAFLWLCLEMLLL